MLCKCPTLFHELVGKLKHTTCYVSCPFSSFHLTPSMPIPSCQLAVYFLTTTHHTRCNHFPTHIINASIFLTGDGDIPACTRVFEFFYWWGDSLSEFLNYRYMERKNINKNHNSWNWYFSSTRAKKKDKESNRKQNDEWYYW